MEPTGSRPLQVALVALCGLLLLAPAVDTVLRRDPTRPPQERRLLAARPELPRSLAAAAAFPRQADAWLADHFGLRSTLLALNSRFRFRVLGVAPSPEAKVMIGRDGWLYYVGEKAFDYMLRRNPFTAAELDAWCTVAEAQRKWLEARGIRYLVVIAPNKESIYPEHLPGWVTIPDRPSRADELVAALAARTRVDVLDLRTTLRVAKAANRVYQVTDTHWNGLGAHAAYFAIMQRLNASFPKVHPRSLDTFRQARTWHPGGDMARLLGVTDLLREEHTWLAPATASTVKRVDGSMFTPLSKWVTGSEPVVTEQGAGEIGRAFVLRDSFGQALQPLLSEHFGRAVYLWWSVGFPAEAIEREHPDVVILELVERTLSSYQPTPPPPG